MKGKQIVAAMTTGAIMLLSFSGCSTEPTSLPVEESKTSPTSSTTTSGQSTTTENRQTTTTTTSSTKETETTTTTQATKATKVQTTAEKTTIPTTSTATKSTTATTNNKPTTITTVTKRPTVQQIKQDYVSYRRQINPSDSNLTVNDIIIDQWVTDWQDAAVLFIRAKNDVFTEAEINDVVAGYTLTYNNGYVLSVYKSGQFVSVKEAYNKQWISSPTISKLYYECYARSGREEKIYCNAVVEEDFSDNEVIVCMKKTVSIPGRVYTAEDFPTIDIQSIRTLIPAKTQGEDNEWLVITLPVHNKQNVLNVIKELEKMDDIKVAQPNYYVYLA